MRELENKGRLRGSEDIEGVRKGEFWEKVKDELYFGWG
ncbi:hypothetical protein HMPREF1321_0708 [Capnocytophaga sp. oral taxon 412 str. F0487]|jgi:hypothetical protein|nr:hypothetical protein HMPREF1321_0708 [Capnocytophaga sp. oral taxon 412 str. F0487]